jgi:hypothetical protein
MCSEIKFFKFITLVICMLLFQATNAQSINASIDKKDILIGEQINYTLTFNKTTADQSVNILIPDSIEHFDIISKNIKDTILIDGTKQLHALIVFTSFDSGTFSFPPLSYSISNSNKNFTTDSVSINVGYMPFDKDKKIRDVKSIVEVDYFNTLWIKLGIILLALLIVLFIIIRYFVKRKKINPTVNTKNAYQVSMEALEKLRKSNAENSISVKELHTELANILKYYYGAVVNTNLKTQTSAEILDKLRTYQLNAETAFQAEKALETGDATKFAKYSPSMTENETAIKFIENTIQQINILQNKKK